MPSIPVLVPGIMGSTLSTGTGPGSRFLWSADFKENYATLVKSSGALRWSGNRAHAKLLNKVVFSLPYIPVPLCKFALWSRLLKWIAINRRLDYARLVEYGYDWRAPLDETAACLLAELAQKIGCDISVQRPQEKLLLLFFAHSMGGVVVQLALGRGFLHPSWIDSLVFIGTPHKGSPSAFRSAYSSLSLPLFKDIFNCITGRNRAVFFNHLLECIRTFPSIYSLFPPDEILYLYYSPSVRSNPLAENVMPRECIEIARRTHSALNDAAKLITQHSIHSYSIYTTVNEDRLTELEYRVTQLPRDQSYQIVETISTTMRGDGTVPEESARGAVPPLIPMTVTNVAHDVMCDSSLVVNCLDSIFVEVPEDDSSLQYR
jgi:hypothetical protein